MTTGWVVRVAIETTRYPWVSTYTVPRRAPHSATRDAIEQAVKDMRRMFRARRIRAGVTKITATALPGPESLAVRVDKAPGTL